MTTMLTRFPLPTAATPEQMRASFVKVAPAFREAAGLVRKYFLLSQEEGMAGGVYLWRSRRDALAFEVPLRKMIRTELGVEPTITLFETPVIVDNPAGEIWTGGVVSAPVCIPPSGGGTFDFGGLAVTWKIDSAPTRGAFSIVHHPIAPRALAAPLHRHSREDEYSYVLRGRLGALLGEDVVFATAGSWVFKPRGQWHTFWNPDDEPCEIIEVISPGGFEDYFREVAAAWGNLEAFATINEKYALEMDFASVPDLCDRFELRFPEL